MNYRFKYTLLFSLVFFVLSFAFGYFIMDNKINKENNEISINHQNNDGNDVAGIEIVREENRITPNTKILWKTFYKECGDSTTLETEAADEMINFTKSEFEEYLNKTYPNHRLIDFSSSKVSLYEEKDHLCKNHFVVGTEKDRIAIFRIGDNGERILDKLFDDYPISVLRELDQEKIREGIIVDSEDELYNLLENFIS